jgi:hypothetical protein
LECTAAGLSRYAEDHAPHLFFSFVGTVMPEGEGSLFGDLDAALQSGSSENAGAEFSENGFASLLKAAETDDKLAEKTGSRLDHPLGLLRSFCYEQPKRGGPAKLSKPNAQRPLRFWQVREVTARSA